MSLLRVILVSVSALTLAGCASTSADLVPLPSTEGPFMVSGDGVGKLMVQVQNQGEIPSESSPVTVTFFLRKLTVTSALQDGGGLQPGEASRVLDFEIPQACLEEGCTFQVSVDPRRKVQDGNRANNRVRGRCEGENAYRVDPSLGTLEPSVQ